MSEWEGLHAYGKAEMLREMAKPIEAKPSLSRSYLCARCANGVVFSRRQNLQVVAFCTKLGTCGEAGQVPLDLVECSGFEERGVAGDPLEQMVKLAEDVNPKRGGVRAGFRRRPGD